MRAPVQGYSMPVGVGDAQIVTTSRAAMIAIVVGVLVVAWLLARKSEKEKA